MKFRQRFVVAATMASALAVPSIALGSSLVNINTGGSLVNASPAVCANVLAVDNSCSAKVNQTSTNQTGSGQGGSNGLVNLNTGGSLVNVSPAVCANVLAVDNTCQASVNQNTTNPGGNTGGGNTGGGNTGGGNVSTGGTGGGLLASLPQIVAAAKTNAIGGGLLPRAGMASMIAVALSALGASMAALYRQQIWLAIK